MNFRDLGKSDTYLAQCLGVSRRTFVRYKNEGAPFPIALACNCLLNKIPPYE